MTKKVALVTGSTRGIGFEILKEFCKNGYTGIMTCSAMSTKANEALSTLRSQGLEAILIPCDISDSNARERLFAEIRTRLKRLDVVINNAGVAPEKRVDLLDATEESFDRVIGINLKGTFFMCRDAARLMIELQNRKLPDYASKIINISLVSAYTVSRNRGEYCVSKAGISMCTMLFAERLAEHGIPVFEIRPGIIKTDMTSDPEVENRYNKLIDEGLTPIKRWGTPKDIADAVMTLVGGKLDFVTGQVINADGGFHIRRL